MSIDYKDKSILTSGNEISEKEIRGKEYLKIAHNLRARGDNLMFEGLKEDNAKLIIQALSLYEQALKIMENEGIGTENEKNILRRGIKIMKKIQEDELNKKIRQEIKYFRDNYQ